MTRRSLRRVPNRNSRIEGRMTAIASSSARAAGGFHLRQAMRHRPQHYLEDAGGNHLLDDLMDEFVGTGPLAAFESFECGAHGQHDGRTPNAAGQLSDESPALRYEQLGRKVRVSRLHRDLLELVQG